MNVPHVDEIKRDRLARITSYTQDGEFVRVQWVQSKVSGGHYPWRVYRNGRLRTQVLFDSYGLPCGVKDFK